MESVSTWEINVHHWRGDRRDAKSFQTNGLHVFTSHSYNTNESSAYKHFLSNSCIQLNRNLGLRRFTFYSSLIFVPPFKGQGVFFVGLD